MIVEQIPAIGKLSARDKYILANELWEEIEANEASVPLRAVPVDQDIL